MTTIEKLKALPNPFMGVHLPPRPQITKRDVEKLVESIAAKPDLKRIKAKPRHK
jgi:hypothetical protein